MSSNITDDLVDKEVTSVISDNKLLTATKLYQIDSTFQIMMDQWVESRIPPVPLIDRLLENDLESQANCVRWVLDRGEVRVQYSNSDGLLMSHSFPRRSDHTAVFWLRGKIYFCVTSAPEDSVRYSHWIWWDYVRTKEYITGDTYQETILKLLDLWI